MLLAEAKTSKVCQPEVQGPVLTARCRVPRLLLRVSTCAGSGARKYLRRARYYAGDVMSLMLGCRGAGRLAQQELKDREGQRFVGAAARRKTRHVQQPSPRQSRTLRPWRPAKAPSTWAQGAAALAAASRVANPLCPGSAKRALPLTQMGHLKSNHVACFAPRPRLMRQADAP